MAEPVRLALLGCGWIARNRLRQIATDGLAEVVAVIDPSAEACAGIHDLAPAARVQTDAAALDLEQVDGVMISTPTGLHAEQAVELLRRGVPVFVQKPLGISTVEVAQVLEAAARSDVPVETDLCYRHLRSARALRSELGNRTVGKPFYIEGCFHNAYRPNARWSVERRLAGGGALMDLGIHLLDLLSWVTGQRVFLGGVQLRHRGVQPGAADVEDFARLDLSLEDGAEVRLLSSWDASTGRDAEIRLCIYGANGNLELINRDGSFFDFDARRCFGTWVDHLATDVSDDWQAGPLRHWLRQVRERAGYEEPAGVRQTAAIIDEAYKLGRPDAAAELPKRRSVCHPAKREHLG
ncbi:MAG: Gfo/Idh/MocA family protein [Pseudomonadales bacterium]